LQTTTGHPASAPSQACSGEEGDPYDRKWRNRCSCLSNDEDFDRVDGVRASCDAILVGANTIRRDDPRLLIRSPGRTRARLGRGMTPHPVKVTMTTSGSLDRSRKFFTAGDGPKLVYCPGGVGDKLREILGAKATVVETGDRVHLGQLLADLGKRGVRRLMVEGGSTIHTQFLAAGLVDELHLAIGPFLVGDPEAPRFVTSGAFPWNQGHRMVLAEARALGDVAFLRYELNGGSEMP
jgi:5-amino-6-(5-phosphoribosylamino)uracil reductase